MYRSRKIDFVSFKTMVWGFPYISWHCFSNKFPDITVKKMVTFELTVTKSKNSICQNGCRTVFPIKRISSNYITKNIMILRSNLIRIFVNIVETLETGSRPKRRHRTLNRLPGHRNLTNFLDDLLSGTEINASFKSILLLLVLVAKICTENSFPVGEISGSESLLFGLFIW